MLIAIVKINSSIIIILNKQLLRAITTILKTRIKKVDNIKKVRKIGLSSLN
jgi:hypothetical protein